MQSGAGNTALVLDAFSRMRTEWRTRHDAAINRGFAFLLANLDDDGYVSAPQHSADFPTYATALLLSAVDRMHPDRWQRERDRMRRYLLQSQRLRAERGVDFGGWPQTGGEPADAATETNVNISVSRFVAESLAGSGSVSLDTSHAARTLLDRCRNPEDGGFCFVPAADDPLNKAGQEPAGPAKSYGTATADGLLALSAWGVPDSDFRIHSALRWLESQRSLDVVPGFSSADQGIVGAERALKYYYWAALAQVMAKFPDSSLAARRAELRALIVREQQPDGAWRNADGLMREDDPLIATAFAVTAIATLDNSTAE